MLNAALSKYTNSDPGYFCLSIINNGFWKNNFYNITELNKANEFINANKGYDSYNSIATFYTPNNRTSLNVKLLNAHSIDIDNHLNPFTEQEARSFIDNVLMPLFDVAIPTPSLIVYTGRGLHLHFNLKGASDIPKWQLTQKALINTIENICYKNNSLLDVKGLEVDKQVNDISRVMRTPGTYNSKSNSLATVIYESNNTYTQDEIINNYNLKYRQDKGKNKGTHFLRDSLKNIDREKILKASARALRVFKTYNPFYTVKTLNRERRKDLLKLIQIRNSKGENEGYRNTLIAIMLQLEQEDNNKNLLDTLCSINQEFNKPLDPKELIAWFGCAITKPQYYYSNKTIIDKLDISIEEQEQLSVIISRQVKNKRYYNKNREELLKAANNKYLPIKTLNTASRNALKLEAKRLKQQGLTVNEIAKKLGKCSRQIMRYLRGK